MLDDPFNSQLRVLRRHQKIIKNARQYQTLHFAVKRLVNYISSDVVLRGIIDELKGKTNDVQDVKKAAHILVGSDDGHRSDEFENEFQFILRSYFVLEICSTGNVGIEHQAAKPLCKEESNEHERYEKIDSILVDPVIDYLVDELDAQKYVLSSMSKYKQKTEWFNKTKLQKIIDEEKKKARSNNRIENILNLGIYEYLHDRGVDFYLEAISAESRGRVDLIGAQGSNPQLLLDGKYLENPSKVSNQICKAFWQVFKYAQQYNRQFGYVVSFNNIENNVRLDFPELGYSIPSVVLEGKIIFFIIVDIFYHGSTPSQRNKSKDIVIRIDNILKKH